jgi:uncharacterized protein (TIGR02145 family)
LFQPFDISDDIFEFGYTFSFDGQECFFTRNGGIYETSTVMMAHIENGYWSEPVIAPFTNNDYNLAISADGSKLYFNSYREFPDYTSSPIWFSTRSGNSWSSAEETGIDAAYVSITDDGTLYHFKWINGRSCITRSRYLNGDFQQIEMLPAPVNSEQYNDMHPCIAPDESYLIFDSENRPRQNDCGLFISFRNNDGSWSEPVNMGSIITQSNAGMAKVTLDEKYLFFNDWYGDNYWVDATIINQFRTDSSTEEIIDYDRNSYKTIQIGDQVWTAENWQCIHAPDGTQLTGVSAYDDNEIYVSEYGRLYTWESALNAAPSGWHLPSDEEWEILINSVELNPADELRSGGSTGFNAQLGGRRTEDGEFGYLGEIGIYWTATQSDASHARVKLFVDDESNVVTNNTPKGGAKSVRYIKN